MKTTARFEIERKQHLQKLFTKKRLIFLWRNLVRQQLRRQDIQDLHDYYDFSSSLETRIDRIISDVLSGQYRPNPPLVYRVEKKFGVCRHQLIPSATDALVLQLLTDQLYEDIRQSAPSKNAFYARDRHNLPLPHNHEQAAEYAWFTLWPKYQKEIWNFSKAHKYLVATDIANYFDNIGLRELRHRISEIARTKEVYLDLLFSLIEDLSWNPDYLPRMHKGLPTIDIEAPRLLAHALLFESDKLLKRRTKNCFVRWMDDINFGVSDTRAATAILGELNDMLKSRGLALNLGKTTVMSAREAQHHFLFNENLRLDKLIRRARNVKRRDSKVRLANRIETHITRHLKCCHSRNKSKVTKRYLTALRILGIPVALKKTEELFIKEPSLRGHILSYLSQLPFAPNVAALFIRLIKETEFCDDATRFAFSQALVRWNVPITNGGMAFVKNIKREISEVQSPFDWLCQLIFLVKYGDPSEVVEITKRGTRDGMTDPFFCRQRIAAMARGLASVPHDVLGEWDEEIKRGSQDSSSVAQSLKSFSQNQKSLDSVGTQRYFFPNEKQHPYPVAKFLSLCVIAYAERQDQSKKKRSGIKRWVDNPWFMKWLEQINPNWA